jgi:tetratricopeptide (TPR) repeat protein
MEHGVEQLVEAARLRERAERAAGADEALALLRRAQSLLAAVPLPEEVADEDESHRSLRRAHGDISRRIAETLLAADDIPGAMQSFQEATDAYGGLPGAEQEAAECARQILAGVKALRARPEDRLLLLIARHDRELRQLSEEAGTERARADLLFRMGTIFQRRDRLPEAASRYAESLSLYEMAEDTELARAAAHHRLADLYRHELNDRARAITHYRKAIPLYARHEPASEDEQMNRTLCEWHLKQMGAEVETGGRGGMESG